MNTFLIYLCALDSRKEDETLVRYYSNEQQFNDSGTKILIFNNRATLVVRCKFVAVMANISWEASSAGVLDVLRPIFREFAREYPNLQVGF